MDSAYSARRISRGGKGHRHARVRVYTTQDAYILSNMNIVIENTLSSSNAK